MDLARFELATSSLQMKRYNQLSHRPIVLPASAGFSPALWQIQYLKVHKKTVNLGLTAIFTFPTYYLKSTLFLPFLKVLFCSEQIASAFKCYYCT